MLNRLKRVRIFVKLFLLFMSSKFQLMYVYVSCIKSITYFFLIIFPTWQKSRELNLVLHLQNYKKKMCCFGYT